MLMNTVRHFPILLFICLTAFSLPQTHAVEIERVSVSSSGEQGNGSSSSYSVSADGRFVAFLSEASNLVKNDNNNVLDVFVHDRVNGITERVSVSSNAKEGDNRSSEPVISGNGRFVVFSSIANNLVDNDTNMRRDIFIHDRQTGITERVSVSSSGVQGDSHSGGFSISTDGRIIVFRSDSSNLIDGIETMYNSGNVGTLLHDRATGVTELISISSAGVVDSTGSMYGTRPSISEDGRFVVFESVADNLVDDDIDNINDIFIRDRQLNITKRVTVAPSGTQNSIYDYGNDSFSPVISADGKFIAFTSRADHLVDNEVNGWSNIFIYERETGITKLVSSSLIKNQGISSSFYPSISADGRFVTYNSDSTDLVEYDTNRVRDVFVFDRYTELTERVSVGTNGEQAGGQLPSISADGRFIAFTSRFDRFFEDNTNGNYADALIAKNISLLRGDKVNVSIWPTSSVVNVGAYIQFRARIANTSNQPVTNCTAQIINPRVKFQREFSFFSWPLNVPNPILNGGVDIAPGETGQILLNVLPRVPMNKEVRFLYSCDTAEPYTVPFVNTVNLKAKIESLISEDFVQLDSGNNKTRLLIDRANGKYWTPYIIKVINSGSQPSSVNLATTKDISGDILGQPQLCEPTDPINGDWSCVTPRDAVIQVTLVAGEVKRILLFVHAKQAIEKQPIKNRIFVEARDQDGGIVAVHSIGVHTTN